MDFTIIQMLVVLGVLAGMLCLSEIGRRIGVRRLAQDPEAAKAGSGTVEVAVFGLMGLLIGFTFSHAATRFDTRRETVVEEANCIGTAWLRLDLLPKETQPALREKFRQYTDARIAVFQKIPDMVAANVQLAQAGALQKEIWNLSVAACRSSDSPSTAMLVLPAMNQMFDMATTRTMGAQMHPPVIIYVMLVLLVLCGTLLVGYGTAAGRVHNWFYTLTFVLVLSMAIYVILDFEYPRMGLIRLSGIDQVLMDVRESMNP